ncbi:hypothetical protein Tco_1319460 [Tanacetum coccineum]
MTTLADKAILSGADNRPPMLEKDMYDSWKSIIELYIMNRQHGRMILEFVENGPLIWPIIEENGVTRPKKYSMLSATETIQADCDIKATHIILHGVFAVDVPYTGGMEKAGQEGHLMRCGEHQCHKVDERRQQKLVARDLDLQNGKEGRCWLVLYGLIVSGMSMKIRYHPVWSRGMILAAQSEAFKQENVLAERLHHLDQQMEGKGDRSLYFMD